MANIPTNESIELELGVPQQVSLSQSGMWYFKPQSPNQIIQVSLNESMNNPWSSKDFMGGVIPVPVSTSLEVWVAVVELNQAPTCNVIYTNSFGLAFFNLGGGSGTYTFASPLANNNGNISLNLASDLALSGSDLTLSLLNNSDFIALSQLVQSLTGGVSIVGKTTNTNAEVTANKQLLTDYVNSIRPNGVRVGDTVFTADQPPYVWTYTNVYNQQGAITGQEWIGLGTIGAGIATQNTLGLVMGSNTISVATSGALSVQNVLQLTGDYTVQGNITFDQPLVLGRILRFSVTDGAIIAPSTDITDSLYLQDSSIGSNCAYNLEMGGISRMLNLPQPQSDNEPVRLTDLNSRLLVFSSTDSITTSNLPTGAFGFKLSTL